MSAASSSAASPSSSSSYFQKSPRMRYYFSRKPSTVIKDHELPLEHAAMGIFTFAGMFFACVRLTVPMAYIYILLILLREACEKFPETIHAPIEYYFPYGARIVDSMQKSSTIVEIWAIFEAIFYIFLKLKIQYLQYKDPLEASLSAAPMLELPEREKLWNYMMESVQDDPTSFVTGWFFDEKLENITKYDFLDFVTWSMFEGRNQEHLTEEEVTQLALFVEEAEWRISLHLYGIKVTHPETHPCSNLRENIIFQDGNFLESTEEEDVFTVSPSSFHYKKDMPLKWHPNPKKRAQPMNTFSFKESTHDSEPSFFTNLYESYNNRYEQYWQRFEEAEFRPVQGLKNFVAEKRQQIYKVEEHAKARATHICENTYFTFIEQGSNLDKQLTAFSHARQTQLMDAWNSVFNIKERIETATFLASRRKRLQQQLKGYRALLDRMRAMSMAIPSKQMADLMRKITQCNESMETIEGSAMNAFSKATGFATHMLFEKNEPCRYAKYSSDPLYGVKSYPLMFHLLILSLTDGGLRYLMKQRGFQRLSMGPISYYYHAGDKTTGKGANNNDGTDKIPFVFCHGIGIGLITYLPFIDGLLAHGRPIFLPEIPYITGFRPWQSSNSILTPAAVSGVLTAMLASHGHFCGNFIGHSFGTSWLSYMCKYATHSVAAVMFIDPICFCLHFPKTTKAFVYHRADPGSISYMIRTDVIINWTMQRCFPWAHIVLFKEQLPKEIPCAIYLSEKDKLVPCLKVESYFRSKGADSISDFNIESTNNSRQGLITVTILRGEGHGDWTICSRTMQKFAEDAEKITIQSEARKNQ